MGQVPRRRLVVRLVQGQHAEREQGEDGTALVADLLLQIQGLAWATVAADRVGLLHAAMSYNVFTCSDADLQRIRELYRATFTEVRALIAASAPSERVVLVQQHVLPIDNP